MKNPRLFGVVVDQDVGLWGHLNILRPECLEVGLCIFGTNADSQKIPVYIEQGCRKRMPSASISFSHKNLLYVPNVKM